jgi:hypothetical protein
MPSRFTAIVLLVLTTTARPDDTATLPVPDGYAHSEALARALRRIAREHPDRVRLRSLTRTAQGRDVWLVELRRNADAPGDTPPKPTILLVANLEADHLVGSQVALGMIERLATAGADSTAAKVLDRAAISVVPRLNPDGAERLLGDLPAPVRTNLSPIDRDRDGRSGEDGPDDLDGDRQITALRARDSRATLVPDGKDPRVLRKADAARGEAPVYSEYIEGRDDDADGALNEDPPGGVNLNRNWPRNWPEFDREAGPTPVGEPETRALIRYAFDHPEIVAVWSFGLRDNLREEPKKDGSGLDKEDLPIVAELSKAYRKAIDAIPKTKLPEGNAPPRPEVPVLPDAPTAEAPRLTLPAPDPDGTPDGSIHEWAYHQFGVLGLTSRLWGGPDWEKPPEGQEGPPKDGEARWLFWNDRVVGGRAFVPLKPFDHPTLGPVLLGGWKPGVRLNPPIDQVAAITGAHARFLEDLAARVPSLELSAARAKPLGGGLFEVTAIVRNDGSLPTALSQGVRTRQARPVLVRVAVGDGKVVGGKPLERIDALAGGGHHEVRWIVAMPEGARSVTIEAATPKAGRARAVVDLN